MTQLHADDGFLEYYQFEHDPFLGRGSSFKFFAAKRRSVLVELHHLARYSKLMLVVTGPQGSGKTVLRQALVASSKEPVKSVVIAASASADAAAMLQQVSAALGLHNADIAGVLRHIEQMLITGQEVHVIVDNAECLDESAFLFLQRVAQGVNDASARVFVFSDSTICPLLKKVADNADLHHVIALEPWSEQEVNEYLEQRLITAGQSLDVFTEEQLADVYAESQGWPGQVNSVAKNLLLENMHPKVKAKARKSGMVIPFKHLAILVLLGLALAFVWFMQDSGSEDKVTAVSIDSGVIEPVVTPVEAVINPAKTVTMDLPLDKPLEPVVREPLAQAMSAEDEEQFIVEEQSAEIGRSIDNSASEPREPTPVSAPVPISMPKPISTPPEKVLASSTGQSVALAQKPVQRSKPVVKAPVQPAVVKPVATVSGLSGTAGDSQWYKQQAKSRYTLQVLGTRSESTALTFVKQNRSQYHYFRKLHQGQSLFVVTYGSFADRTAAQVAINNLPEKIRKDKPWPRTFLSIQQELR